MSHPIKNMPAGYEIQEVREFDPKEFDSVIVTNYARIARLTNYSVIGSMENEMTDEYTTAIFRIKWKN